ncbi:MAG: Xaa-Pro dipeptidyl-peptidase [Gemmatimonadota bacterium]|nr:Xaa-Pro dipeptidyl-peptidase [Gemmatimonadota bacterium]
MRLITPTLAAPVAAVIVMAGLPYATIAQQPAGPAFVDGQAQVVEAFADSSAWIRHELWVETEFDTDGDGQQDRMHVAVVRPAQTESAGLRVPVVYGTSPYYAGTSSTNRRYLWSVRQEVGGPPPERELAPPVQQRLRPGISGAFVGDWVPRGFAVVHSSSPGTGLSQGCPTVGGPNESLAPKAVIDWLNGRAKGFTTPEGDERVEADWSTGRVGMTGTSYNGTLPVAAATTGVDGLEAIIPVSPNTSYYHYYRSYGLVRHPGGWLGEDIDFLYDFIHSGDPARRDYCNETVRDTEMAEGRDRITGDYNEFWEGRDYLNVIDGVKAATLMSHAFNDWNVMPYHSVRITEALKERGVPVQHYYHQGGHGGPPPFEMMNRWFTRYLYGIENGVENDPKAWIVRGDDDRLEPTPYPDYPNPEAEPVGVHLERGGIAWGGLSMSRNAGQGTEALVDNVSFDGATLAQAEWTNHRLLYVTPELREDVHLSGTPQITVRMSADQAAVNLSVWLVQLPFDGEDRLSVITRGWADPQNRGDHHGGGPLEPGEFVEFSFELQPDDQVIPAGKRIGLMIFSSDRDFTLWPTPGSELTVDLDRTSLSLPVVGGADALARALREAAQ